MSAKQKIPTILTILGVTGDLAAIKILPALFSLSTKGVLPEKFRLIGFGRKPFTSESFRPYVREKILVRIPDASPADLDTFLSNFDYVQGNFDEPKSYDDLAIHMHTIEHEWNELANFIFYLSVPPDIYEPIITHIRGSALYKNDPDFQSRVLVEKPIGNNASSAEFLERLLNQSFKEHEVYRIDHYLAKEMVQNILTFRFANDMFEHTWNNKAIEKIEIRLWETLGVEKRGDFYDAMGALRDVGQNHLLQILALLTMYRPIDFTANSLHAKRSEILNKLKPLTAEEVTSQTFRAQYSGYRTISGVNAESNTETYFKIRGYIDDQLWDEIPVIIESGKRMHEQRKDIIITYKHSQPCVCPDQNDHQKNRIVFSLEPYEGIKIEFWSKQTGFNSGREKRSIDFMLRDSGSGPQYIAEYEKLLLDAILGDQTLFVSNSEIKAMWRFIDPIIEGWKQGLTPLDSYTPDTSEAIDKTSI